jgi:hypothetical protein
VIRAAMQAQRKAEPRSASFHRTPDEPFRLGGLAATTAGAALLYALTGFGFAVLAAPLVLLFVDPPRAIQLVILISTALSFVTLPGLWRAVATGLLSRLGLGSLAGLPFGLVAFRYADPVVVRALVGATIPAFAALLEIPMPGFVPKGPENSLAPRRRRDPDPLRASRRACGTASRRSGGRRRLCHPRHPTARGSRALHPCRRDRCGCSLTITSRFGVTSRRGTVTDLGRTVYFYSAASPCSTAFANLEG